MKNIRLDRIINGTLHLLELITLIVIPIFRHLDVATKLLLFREDGESNLPGFQTPSCPPCACMCRSDVIIFSGKLITK